MKPTVDLVSHLPFVGLYIGVALGLCLQFDMRGMAVTVPDLLGDILWTRVMILQRNDPMTDHSDSGPWTPEMSLCVFASSVFASFVRGQECISWADQATLYTAQILLVQVSTNRRRLRGRTEDRKRMGNGEREMS